MRRSASRMISLARGRMMRSGRRPLPRCRRLRGRSWRAGAAKQKAAPAPVIPLLDEELKGYTLSYGGTPTYVYTAHTAGTGATLDYVTVGAQAEGRGGPKGGRGG